jgi:hypothetical protein
MDGPLPECHLRIFRQDYVLRSDVSGRVDSWILHPSWVYPKENLPPVGLLP